MTGKRTAQNDREAYSMNMYIIALLYVRAGASDYCLRCTDTLRSVSAPGFMPLRCIRTSKPIASSLVSHKSLAVPNLLRCQYPTSCLRCVIADFSP